MILEITIQVEWTLMMFHFKTIVVIKCMNFLIQPSFQLTLNIGKKAGSLRHDVSVFGCWWHLSWVSKPRWIYLTLHVHILHLSEHKMKCMVMRSFESISSIDGKIQQFNHFTDSLKSLQNNYSIRQNPFPSYKEAFFDNFMRSHVIELSHWIIRTRE